MPKLNEKIKVAILFGGRSAEHEVSLQSAINVIHAMDKNKYDPVLIGIGRTGKWYLDEQSLPLLRSENPVHAKNPILTELNKSNDEIMLAPSDGQAQLVSLANTSAAEEIDVIFPVLHGPYGEDGSVQGLARLANVPCVGSGILGSAIGMDKDVAKRLLRADGIPVANFMAVRRNTKDAETIATIEAELGFPVFVKPANMGSSVGISKAANRAELELALAKAFAYDVKVIVEETIDGREIECAVLGNTGPRCSVPGEIITQDEFYSYAAKYVDENATALAIPADVEPETTKQLQNIALQAFTTLEATGMARVDMFLTKDQQIYINEINTIPGFTKISMYPKLWEASGISYTELIDKLIALAIEDFGTRSALKNV
ncbi:MAG: D-alanine--D-alanine ligase [Pseudomonadales bacterium]